MGVNTVFQATNYQLGKSGVFCLGENKTTGKTGIYYVPAQFDEGLSVLMGTLLSNAREKQMVFNQNGSRGCYIFQNEVMNEKTISLSFIDDAIYWKDTVVARVDRNLLSAIMLGESFKDGTDVIKVIGTNGTRMVEPVETNAEPRWLFEYAGKNAKPQSDDGTGKPILQTNVDNNAYKRFGVTVGIEAIYEFDNATKLGMRLLFCAPKTGTFTDGQPNKKVIEFDVFCDTLYVDKGFDEGVSNPDVVATTGTTPIYAINANYVIAVSGGGKPTFTKGAVGDVAVVIDTDDGSVEIYKKDATDWGNTSVTSVLGAGAMIYGAKSGTSLATEPTGKSVYVGIKTAGATGVAVASKTKTTTGTGTEDYMLAIKKFDVGNAEWDLI